jgi:hypothetical protein
MGEGVGFKEVSLLQIFSNITQFIALNGDKGVWNMFRKFYFN